jgi:CRP/FNR family transcriptional regulator, cyclic AMP receptor protein
LIDGDQSGDDMPNVAASVPLVVRAEDHVWTTLPGLAAARDVVLSRGWLSTMPSSFQQRVLDRCLYRKVEAGAVISRAGAQASGMYGLVSGSLSIEVASQGQNPHLGSFFVPGSWWGEAPVLTGVKRWATVKATLDSGLMFLSARGVNAILEEDPDAWRCFYRLTLRHLDKTISLYDDLKRRDQVERFIAVLLQFGDCRFETPRHGGPFGVYAAQEDLARIANISRSTAQKILRKLEKAGSIELSYRRIRILSPDALRSALTG